MIGSNGPRGLLSRSALAATRGSRCVPLAWRSLLGSAVLLTVPTASGQFWDYQYICTTGQLTARASIEASGPGVNLLDTDQADFASSYTLPDPAVLDFNDSRLVSALVSGRFVDDCRTEARSEISGRTAYALTGDNDEITIGINSRRSHYVEVQRQSGGPGSAVLTASIYDIAQPDSLTLVFPIRVAGHPLGGTVTLRGFTINRLDSNFNTEGITRCSWEWFHDENSNGQIDPTEIALGSQVGQVFAGGSFSASPVSFHAARGYHLLRVTYFTNSSFGEAGHSWSCAFPSQQQGDVNDTVSIELGLSAP
jgi:hypothetical protein